MELSKDFVICGAGIAGDQLSLFSFGEEMGLKMFC